MNFPTAGAEASAYGKRGNRAANACSGYRIDGEYVTVPEIAERIGKSMDFVRRRMAELRKASGAITFDRLKGAA